jgi:hypothetical protein
VLVSVAQVKELTDLFMSGHLDVFMVDTVKRMDPSFQFSELCGVLTQHDVHLPELSRLSSSSQHAQMDDVRANFERLKTDLVRDVTAFETHSQTRQKVSKLEAEDDRMTAAVKRHAACYCVGVLTAHSDFPAFFDKTLVNVSAYRGPRLKQILKPDDMLRLNIINAASLGPQGTCILPTLADLIANDHAINSTTTMTVIVLPNTPQWGKCCYAKGSSSNTTHEQDAGPWFLFSKQTLTCAGKAATLTFRCL